MSDLSSGCGGDSDLEYCSGSETSDCCEGIITFPSNLVEDSDQDSMEMDEVYATDDSLSSPGEDGNISSGDEKLVDNSEDGGDGGSDRSGGKEAEVGENVNTNNNNKASTTTNDFYFEGVEKLLEIWFTRLDGKVGGETNNGNNCNLRRIPRYQLEEMLKLVHCEIIDSASNDEIDSYVLSESSMFVSQRRLILKTCGTTTPLQCLKFLWTLVKEFTDFDCIEDVYYSHKNYKRPQVQKLPYRKFDNEVQLLDDFFQGSGNPSGGSAYCLGSMNRDCWYLYTYHAPMSAKNQGVMHRRLGTTATGNFHRHLGYPNHHHHHQNHNNNNSNNNNNNSNGKKHQRGSGGRVTKATTGQHGHGQQHNQMIMLNAMSMLMFDEPDQTLEILMSDLDQDVMQIFTQKQCKSAKEATEKSGIDRIIPGMKINDHLFEPCGYSMNGIIKDPLPSKIKNQGTYMTIHITPEQEFSYVSFETNVAMSSYKEIIGRVLDAFRPGKFVLTFFANKASKGYPAHKEMNKMEVIKDHWLRMDNQFCRLEKNDLTYAMYTKFPS